MRLTIVALAVLFAIPTLAIAQEQRSVATMVLQGSDPDTGGYRRALTLARPLADSAIVAAAVVARSQEPQSPRPQKRMKSKASVVAGLILIGAGGTLLYWQVTCDDDSQWCLAKAGVPDNQLAIFAPLLIGTGVAGVVYGARKVEVPAPSVALRIRF